jgi:putative endonuclease
MTAKDDLGRRGELLAAAHLRGQGMTVLDTNWRCSQGEIDLVARDAGCLVFVEVKTRSGTGYGHPLEAITETRIDAVAVIAARGAAPVVEHLRGVF